MNPRTQWEDLIQRFTENYNLSTRDPKYHYTFKRMATKLSPILKREGIGYLEYFYEECKKKDSFGKYFNYALNPKNVREI